MELVTINSARDLVLGDDYQMTVPGHEGHTAMLLGRAPKAGTFHVMCGCGMLSGREACRTYQRTGYACETCKPTQGVGVFVEWDCQRGETPLLPALRPQQLMLTC